MVVNLGGRRRKERKGEGEGGRKEGGEREGEGRREGGERKGGEREDYPLSTRLVATSSQQAATERTLVKKHGSSYYKFATPSKGKQTLCVIPR